MNSFILTGIISFCVFVIALGFQIKYFRDTRKYGKLFGSFFDKDKEYSSYLIGERKDLYPQLKQVGKDGSDLNALISEINIYLEKTKGTSDYEFIRNKVERKLNMRYDQSTVHLAFPTYIGLMGTFLGVFLGIFMFIVGFDDTGSVSDQSIKNLLEGVLVSMSTSLVGLFLTTVNNSYIGEARKKIEDDKNEFYDFIQTDVTKTASASLVSAISRLHDTVDKFEPAFSSVIDGFKQAFRECTKAFGEDFRNNVNAVNKAVVVMGANMDKINHNIQLQERLLDTMKSRELVRGMEKYVEAANHFVSITQSLDKFEEARRMMLAAAQEAICIQNKYNESLKVPCEIAIRVNQILERIKDFETAVTETSKNLTRRDILGNEVIKVIENQVKGIAKKSRIADKYLEIADGKLNDLFIRQTEVINKMNDRYKNAIEGHIEGFEEMLLAQTKELESRHAAFVEELQTKFNIDDIRSEFSNLKKLDEILQELKTLGKDSVKAEILKKELQSIKEEFDGLGKHMKDITEESGKGSGKKGIFGW